MPTPFRRASAAVRRQRRRAKRVQHPKELGRVDGIGRRKQRSGMQAVNDELLDKLATMDVGSEPVHFLGLQAPARRLVCERLLFQLCGEMRYAFLQPHAGGLFQTL